MHGTTEHARPVSPGRLPHLASWALVACALAVAGWLDVPRAHACAPATCGEPSLFPVSGNVPVDQFVPTYRSTYFRATAADARAELRMLRVTRDGRRVPIPFDLTGEPGEELILRPLEPLPAGAVVEIEADPPPCGEKTSLRATYALTAPRPPPGALGTLQASYARSVLRLWSSPQCVASVDVVYADLALVAFSDAALFAGLLKYQLFVDDWPVHPLSPKLSPGAVAPMYSARVHAVCQLPAGGAHLGWSARLGTHRAKVVGTLPNGAVVQSDELTFTLNCADFPAPPAGWDKR